MGSGSYNDAVGIIFADDAGIQDPSASGWWRIGTEPGVSAPVLSNTPWTTGSTKTFTLNLADNLIEAMNQKGFLDIFVQDDTAVDYITLKVQTGSEKVPEPTTSLGLLGLGLLGASQILHKKGKKL